MDHINKFYFSSYQTAIRFHITNRLLARDWQKAVNQQEACFSDQNLTLNDNISQHLEYKHLLARLIATHCPNIAPTTYSLNDQNCQEVIAKVIYDFYLPKGHYQATIPELKWILKPSMLNNGDEIKLFNNIEEVKAHYSTTKRLGGEHVLQQYMAHPALIDGRKYTFRMPVILTNYAGIFLYKEGYINISALPFDLEDDFKQKKVHITNYVIDGDLAHIEQRSTHTLSEFATVYSQMATIVKQIILGLLKEHPDYLQKKNEKIFEIFGFDFIVDAYGKCWLLEINQGPDAPTFEKNALGDILWNKFWQDIIEDFVLPISLNVAPKRHYSHFTRLLSPLSCKLSWARRWPLNKFFR